MMKRTTLYLSAALLLSACAATPEFDTRGADLATTPQQAASASEAQTGSRHLWGGIIIASSNLKEATQLEILAYPLDNKQKPDGNKAPLGRFLAREAGYLETAIYAPGRAVTVLGTLREIQHGRIGEAEYSYPVLQIDQLHLWPRPGEAGDTQIHFGIGVMLHN